MTDFISIFLIALLFNKQNKISFYGQNLYVKFGSWPFCKKMQNSQKIVGQAHFIIVQIILIKNGIWRLMHVIFNIFYVIIMLYFV